jgi:hypothetical protein
MIRTTRKHLESLWLRIVGENYADAAVAYVDWGHTVHELTELESAYYMADFSQVNRLMRLWYNGPTHPAKREDIEERSDMIRNYNFQQLWTLLKSMQVTPSHPYPRYGMSSSEYEVARQLYEELWQRRLGDNAAIADMRDNYRGTLPAPTRLPARSSSNAYTDSLQSDNRTRARYIQTVGSSSSSSSSGHSSGLRNAPSQMFRRNRLIHGPCAITQAQLRREGRQFLKCGACDNSFAYHRKRESDPIPEQDDMVRDDYRSQDYDQDNPYGYLSSSSGTIRSTSSADHHHDRRGRRSKRDIYDAYVPRDDSDHDDASFDSVYDNISTPHDTSTPSSSSNRRGSARTPADSNGSNGPESETIIDRHNRTKGHMNHSNDAIQRIHRDYMNEHRNSDTATRLTNETIAQGGPAYKAGDRVTPAMNQRLVDCPRSFEEFCAELGTTAASSDTTNCHVCGLTAKLHRPAVLCNITQEQYLVSNRMLAVYENRCNTCCRELHEHNAIASNASAHSRRFKLPAVFLNTPIDSRSVLPPYTFDLYPTTVPSTRNGTGGNSSNSNAAPNTQTFGSGSPLTGNGFASSLPSTTVQVEQSTKLPDLKNFPTFTGNQDVFTFIAALQDRLRLFDVPTDKYLSILKACIPDKEVARRNWVQSELINKNVRWEGRDGAKVRFCRQYAQPGIQEAKFNELNTIQQGQNERASSFIDRLRALLDFLVIDTAEHSLILQCISKFRPDIQHSLREYKLNQSTVHGTLDSEYEYPDLDTVFRVALMYDNLHAAQSISTQPHKSGKKRTIKRTREDGKSNQGVSRPRSSSSTSSSSAASSPSRPRSESRGRSRQRKQRKQGPPGLNVRTVHFAGDCNRCGRPNHKAADCYSYKHADGSLLEDNGVRAATSTNGPTQQVSPPPVSQQRLPSAAIGSHDGKQKIDPSRKPRRK